MITSTWPTLFGNMGETRYLRNAVIVRKFPTYESDCIHVQEATGKPKAIKPSPVHFLRYEGPEKKWCAISYNYNSKNYMGWIPYDNLDPLPFLAAGDFRRIEGAESLDYSSDSSSSSSFSEIPTYSSNELLSAIKPSSNNAVPTAITKFTNPENSLGSNYPVFSPDPDLSAENELISSRDQYDEPFNIFVLPGYTPARMTIYTYVDKKQVARSFEFLVGPSSMTESNVNSVVPIKTGAGFFLLRNGAELGRLNISGYLLETDIVDERRLFLENYYRSYMIDKVNTFHSYFNESSLYLELEGYRYRCILQHLDLAKTSDSMFLFRYSMNLLVLSQEPVGVIKRQKTVTNRSIKQSVAKMEIVRNAATVLSTATGLFGAVYMQIARSR